jgi:hypothetical protein
LKIADGALDAWSRLTNTTPVFGTTALMYPERGAQTLFNLGDDPIDLYYLVVEPYPAPATPTP